MHTVTFSHAFCIVPRSQGSSKQEKTLVKTALDSVHTEPDEFGSGHYFIIIFVQIRAPLTGRIRDQKKLGLAFYEIDLKF